MDKLEKRLGQFWRRVRRGRLATRDTQNDQSPQRRSKGKEKDRDEQPIPKPPKLIDRGGDENENEERIRGKSPVLTNHFIIHMRPKRDGDVDQSRLHAVVPKLVAAELSPSPRKPPKLVTAAQKSPPTQRSPTKPTKTKGKSEFEEISKKKNVIIRRQSSKRSEFVTSSDGMEVKRETNPRPPSQVMQIFLPASLNELGKEELSLKKENNQQNEKVISRSADQQKDRSGMNSSRGSSMGSPIEKSCGQVSDSELHIRIPDSPPLSGSISLLSSSVRPSTVQSTRLPRFEFDDSSGYESGYLSHIDLNTPELSFIRPDSGNLTLETRKIRQRAINGRLRPYRAESHDEIHARRIPSEEPGTLFLMRSSMASHSDIHALIDPNLRNRIDKTKFITCTFEAANAGLDAILGDVVEELKRWIDGSALGVACELHWTVPEKYRSRMHECRLKEAVHRVLRENNRAVLRVEDESHGLKASEDRLAESNTRENQRRNPRNDSFEGVYQRCYTHLLPYCHRDTAHWHHPYWSWHSLDRNQPLMPRAELFSSTGADPHHSSILALHIVSLRLRRPRAKSMNDLLLKAESLLNENLTDERLLRVKVVDIDDNPPEFVENKHQIFRVDLSSFNGTKKIGKLLAVDKDERPNDRFTYHLIPECNPRLKTLLKVDQKTGDLSLSGEIPVNVQDLEIFCALVSPIDHPDLNALAFDSQNASMTRLQVKFLKDDHEKAMALKFYPNNTILTIDPDLVNLKFPLISPYHIPDGITFERGNVDFEPALYASPMSSNWSSSIFSIDSQTGALRVSPLIITVNDQGIFKISVNAIDKKTRQPIAQFTQNVHLIDDEEKLKFVFEMGPAELAYNGERLLRKLADALISEDPEKEIDIVGDKIEKYPGEKMRSSICVHAAKDGRLLSRNDLLGIVSSALQKSTSSLQNLYHIFKVINVESCDTVSYQRPLESANPLSQSFMLMLCVICVVLLFVWALFAYYCFVHRYRLYLDEKQRAAQGLDKKSYPSSTLPPPPIPPHYLPNLPPIY